MRISIVFVCFILLVGCNVTVSEESNYEEFLQKKIINNLNNKDYQEILSMCNDGLRESIEIGETYFIQSLEPIGYIDDFIYEDNVLTCFGKIRQIKIELEFDDDQISDFTFINDVLKYDGKDRHDRLMNIAIDLLENEDWSFATYSKYFDDEVIENEALRLLCVKTFEVLNSQEYLKKVNPLNNEVHFGGHNDDYQLMMKFDDQLNLKELILPELEKIKLSGLIYSDHFLKTSDFYDTSYSMKKEVKDKYAKHLKASYDLAFNFSNELFLNRFKNAYFMLDDEIINNMSFDEFQAIYYLQKKKLGLDSKEPDVFYTYVHLDYHVPFIVTELYYTLPETNDYLKMLIEVQFNMENDSNDAISKIQNFYFERVNMIDINNDFDGLTISEAEQRNSICLKLIDSLKNNRLNELHEIYINNISFEEFVELHNLQIKVYGDLDGLYIPIVSRMPTQVRTSSTSEYVIKTSDDKYKKLIVYFDKNNELLSYDIARVFTEDKSDDVAD